MKWKRLLIPRSRQRRQKPALCVPNVAPTYTRANALAVLEVRRGSANAGILVTLIMATLGTRAGRPVKVSLSPIAYK